MHHMTSFEDFEAFVKTICPDGVTVSWDAGGMSGGSCWGDEPSSYIGDPEPDDPHLVTILEAVAPDLTFVEGMKLMRLGDLYERSQREESHYYGNYSVYASKTLDLLTLYCALRDIEDARG